jgi:tetratricopeptide (TPR) repeat protein
VKTAPAQFMPLAEALALAERHRAQGRLTEAEALCRQVLQADPNVAEAEHLLGVIAHQNGRLSEGIAHLERATELAPQVALFHANLGEMHRLSGSPKLAVKEAKRALALTSHMRLWVWLKHPAFPAPSSIRERVNHRSDAICAAGRRNHVLQLTRLTPPPPALRKSPKCREIYGRSGRI